jgi:hypothetical protein
MFRDMHKPIDEGVLAVRCHLFSNPQLWRPLTNRAEAVKTPNQAVSEVVIGESQLCHCSTTVRSRRFLVRGRLGTAAEAALGWNAPWKSPAGPDHRRLGIGLRRETRSGPPWLFLCTTMNPIYVRNL